MKLLINFEGLDCSFKETNVKNLVKFLNKSKMDSSNVMNSEGFKNTFDLSKYEIINTSFPSYLSGSAFFIKQLLAGSYNDNIVSNRIKNEMFHLDMYHTFHKNLAPVIDYSKNNITILDRYIFSNLYYNPDKYYFYKSQYWRRIEEVSENYFLPIPDITVFMVNTYDFMVEILQDKEDKDVNEENLEYLKKVHHRYINMVDIITEGKEYLVDTSVSKKPRIFIRVDCFGEDHGALMIKGKNELEKEVVSKVLDAIMYFSNMEGESK